MISIIKTAIITIIISIISGLLVERCKNWGPKILCNIGNVMPLEIDNKKVYEYVITVSNLSKKTIHELTLNIHGSHSTINIIDAKITKGLKFDSSIEDDVLDVYIPYLSKGDELSITVYLENRNKPVIAMRSPENFKQIGSARQDGMLASIFSTHKNQKSTSSKVSKESKPTFHNEEDDFTIVMNKVTGNEKIITKETKGKLNRNKKPSKDKKIMLAVGSIIVLVIAGVLVKFGLKEASTSIKNSSVKTDVQKKSNDGSETSGKNSKNSEAKKSTEEDTKNTDSKKSKETPKNVDSNVSTGQGTKNKDAKTSTGETSKNTDAKTSTGEASKNSDTKPSKDETTKNSDNNTSTGEGTKSNDTKTSTTEPSKSVDTNAPKSGTTENKGN